MSNFNFNSISMNEPADISKIDENFKEIEENGITYNEVKGKDNEITKSRQFTQRIGTISYTGNGKINLIRVGNIVFGRAIFRVPKQLGSLSNFTLKIFNTDDFEDWFIPIDEEVFSPATSDIYNYNTSAFAHIAYNSQDTTKQFIEIIANLPISEDTGDYYFAILFNYEPLQKI